jgi:hypothetical protein
MKVDLFDLFGFDRFLRVLAGVFQIEAARVHLDDQERSAAGQAVEFECPAIDNLLSGEGHPYDFPVLCSNAAIDAQEHENRPRQGQESLDHLGLLLGR